jgi:hypothetical protein
MVPPHPKPVAYRRPVEGLLSVLGETPSGSHSGKRRYALNEVSAVAVKTAAESFDFFYAFHYFRVLISSDVNYIKNSRAMSTRYIEIAQNDGL